MNPRLENDLMISVRHASKTLTYVRTDRSRSNVQEIAFDRTTSQQSNRSKLRNDPHTRRLLSTYKTNCEI